MGLEIERKYLISKVDEDFLLAQGATLVEIEQSYLLPSLDFPVRRIRKRVEGGVAKYVYTEKRPASGRFSREEIEYEISENRYLELQKERDLSLSTISKKRYVLSTDFHVLEIDVFPFFTEFDVLEIELSSEDVEVILPSFIEVIEDVTTNYAYTNYSLAKCIP